MHLSSKRAQAGLEALEELMTGMLGAVQQNPELIPQAFQEGHAHLKNLNAGTTDLYDLPVALVGRQDYLGYTLKRVVFIHRKTAAQKGEGL